MEGLTALIQDAERRRLLAGIRVARGAPSLTHMFFADDSYIYCKANGDSADQINLMLQTYERASGQKINKAKSSVFFSSNTDHEVKEAVCNMLDFQEATEQTTYLGLPNVIGRNKTAAFGYLKSRMQNRIEGWDKKYLSKGGKELIIKTVSQALPTYAMSVFLIPKQVCTELESLMCNFWWRSSTKKMRGLHWMSWDRMCTKKSEGGLGFRKMQDFNLALLGKQAWRLVTRQDSMVSKVYKARYYPTGSFLTAKLGPNPSYVWRSILEAQELVRKGIARRVGNGSTVDITKDPWLPCVEDPYIHTEHEALKGSMVSSLMEMDQDRWNEELLKDIFVQRDISLILSIPINRNDNDSWFWRFDKLGHYTVRSVYDNVRVSVAHNQASSNSGFWNKIWNLKIPLKVKHFVWRAVRDCLPTKDRLICRKQKTCNTEGVVRKVRNTDDIVTSALQVLNNWENAQDKSFDNTIGFVTQSDGDVHWKQPQIGTVKVNTDAALFEHSNCFSFAMVARGHEGTMPEAASSCRPGSLHPELAEIIGIRESLSWIKNKNWSSTVVESDCLGAIQAIRCSSINLSYLGRVVDECRKLLDDLESRNVSLKICKTVREHGSSLFSEILKFNS
ncbi:uncharacterized protein LOC141711921 [Apium graveolens]|uniref:uncharacterized protein LOC141711921 n=1 Tax=Apium graveolens TaxID=4045 RepID=UPI003D7B7E6B